MPVIAYFLSTKSPQIYAPTTKPIKYPPVGPNRKPIPLPPFEKTANLATKAAVTGSRRYHINTPIIEMTKARIILTGMKLGVDYSLTHSCYDPDSRGRSCGRCDSCRLRLNGFAEAGLEDPIEYQQTNTK